MNHYEVTIRLTTYSDDPEDWLVDAIGENLEEDEQIDSINVDRITPVFVRDMMFGSKDDASYYCAANGLSPTLIHHTKCRSGETSNDSWLD